MKRWSVVFVLVVVSTLAIVDLVHEFVRNDTIGYFSSRPERLLLVALVAIGGGLLAAGLDHLSHRAKSALRLVAWGTIATVVTCFAAYFTYQSFSLSPLISAGAGGSWVFRIPSIFAILAAYFWFEFYRAWKGRITA